ncbi:transposase [Clostridium paraputrificum]|uniref:transposase n=1 Tax=Clostridium paraputrificum TaxID=29363 RepID=UPI002430A6FD|nr:transposase [Clostridium paraputrificum]
MHRQLIEIYNLKVSEKRVQKLMSEMDLYSVIAKKCNHHSSKNVVEDLEKVLNRDFSTT